MYTECVKSLSGNKRRLWEALLASTQLRSDEEVEQTVLVWDGEKLAACGSRMGNVLKCIAVDPAYQGEGVTATVLTMLKQEAFDAGYTEIWQLEEYFDLPQTDIRAALRYWTDSRGIDFTAQEADKCTLP